MSSLHFQKGSQTWTKSWQNTNMDGCLWYVTFSPCNVPVPIKNLNLVWQGNICTNVYCESFKTLLSHGIFWKICITVCNRSRVRRMLGTTSLYGVAVLLIPIYISLLSQSFKADLPPSPPVIGYNLVREITTVTWSVGHFPLLCLLTDWE